MLIDAAQSEEVRVVVVDNDRIEELEIESMSKEQLRGNVYIAEVSRVEPSLQAAFVNFGSDRNGFLAFSEIHPQYFDVPEDEKKALLEELDAIAERRKARARRLNGEDNDVETSEPNSTKKADSDSKAPAAKSTDDNSAEDDKNKRRKSSARKQKSTPKTEEAPKTESATKEEETKKPVPTETKEAPKVADKPKAEPKAAKPVTPAVEVKEEAKPVVVREPIEGIQVTEIAAAPDVEYAPVADDNRDASKDKAKGVKQVEAPALKTSGIVVEKISEDGSSDVKETKAKEKPIAADVKEEMVEEAVEVPKEDSTKPKQRRRSPSRKSAPRKAESKDEASETESTNSKTETKEEAPKKHSKPAHAKKAKPSKEEPEQLEEEIIEEIDAAIEAEDEAKKSGKRTPKRTSSRRKMEERLEKRHEAQKAKESSKEEDLEEELEVQAKERPVPIHRRYNIADVIKPGQKIVVQVMKETRGNKGAALTTNVSLPGRFTVLMPTTPYAGGISRKISDYEDRKALKEAYNQIDIPERMGLIVRTAGVGQNADSLRKDMNHLMSHWNNIQQSFAKDRAPKLVHEDSSIVVRSLRDMMSDDIGEVIISGRKAYNQAKSYCNALIPEKSKDIKEHRAQLPIFSAYKVESLLHELAHTRADLPSGGYLIINPTEALVSIDVNSGRSTGESNVENTAIHTNIEAAEEVARQLRLRDLSGLVVIDFIDMDDRRNEKKVERKLRECLRKDRARTQTAHISDFGLLEMSRQRLRPSIGETSFDTCPHCNGKGLIRSSASAALMIMRDMQEELVKAKHAHKVIVTTSSKVSLYMLNHKRKLIQELEEKYDTEFIFQGNDRFVAPDYRMEVLRQVGRNEKSHVVERILREDEEGLTPSARRRQRQEAKQRHDTPKVEQDAKDTSPDTRDNDKKTKEVPEDRPRTPSTSQDRKDKSKAKKGGRNRRRGQENIEATDSIGSKEEAASAPTPQEASSEETQPQSESKTRKPRGKRRSSKEQRQSHKQEQAAPQGSEQQPEPAAQPQTSTPEISATAQQSEGLAEQNSSNKEESSKPRRRRGYLRRGQKPDAKKTETEVNFDAKPEQAPAETVKESEDKPKKRRGRPPKKAVEATETPADTSTTEVKPENAAEKPKKRRGRPPKKKVDDVA